MAQKACIDISYAPIKRNPSLTYSKHSTEIFCREGVASEAISVTHGFGSCQQH